MIPSIITLGTYQNNHIFFVKSVVKYQPFNRMALIVGLRNVNIEIRSQHSVETFNSLWVNIVQAINFSNKEKGGLVQKKEQKRP